MKPDNVTDDRGPRPIPIPADLLGASACRLPECSLIAEADHRIANHLSLLAAHVRLQAADLDRQGADFSGASVRLLLLEIGAQITAVARLHRQLSAGDRYSPLDLADQLHDVCAPFQSGLSGVVVIIEDFDRGCLATPENVLPLAQIVTEVITNAIKHAYPQGCGGVIVVRFRKTNTARAVVEVVDHGPGFPVTFDPATDGGLGFQVVRALARQLSSEATFTSSSKGVRFRLSLPLAADGTFNPRGARIDLGRRAAFG